MPTIRTPIRRTISFRQEETNITKTTQGLFGLYRYPAKFIPQVVTWCLKQGDYNSVIDPFAGAGTVGLACHLQQIGVEMWDINPMLKHLAQSVKTLSSTSVPNPLQLVKEAIDFKNSQALDCDLEYLSQWYDRRVLAVLKNLWLFYNQTSKRKRALLLAPLLRLSNEWSYNDFQCQKLFKSTRSINSINDRLGERTWKKNFYADFASKVSKAHNQYITQ